MGRDYALAHFDCPLPVSASSARDNVGDRIFIDGNSAAALGAVYGGATVCAWYPITPSSSLAEAFAKYCRKFRTDPATGKKRYAIVQAEDELASIGMVDRRRLERRARVHRDRPGPGISLMQEFIGLAYFAEIPAVLFDVQRGSPSTGMPTRTQQADLLSCAYASHGDTKHVLLFPEDPTECFEFARAGVRPRRPAADAGLRHARPRHRHAGLADRAVRVGRRAPARPRQGDDRRGARGGQGLRPLPRRRRRRHPVPHLSRHASDARRATSRAAPPRTATRATPRKGRRTSTTCSGCCASSRPRKTLVPGAGRSSKAAQPTRAGVIWFGSTGAAMAEALAALERAGHPPRPRCACARSRSRTRSPTSSPRTTACSSSSRTATRSCKTLLVNECGIDPARLISVLHYDGTPITARFIDARDRARRRAVFNVDAACSEGRDP